MGANIKKPAITAATVVRNHEIFLPLEGLIDVATERKRLERELDKVLRDFDQWAKDSGITFSLSQQWKYDEDYKTLQCRIEGAGNLKSVSRFLYEIEKDPLALKIESVEINARDNNGQQLSLGLQVSGLRLNPRP